MKTIDRRDFVLNGSALAAAGMLPGLTHAAMGPNDKFDLLLRNANVLDPSQGLAGKRDIGMRYGLIEAMESSTLALRSSRSNLSFGPMAAWARPGRTPAAASALPFSTKSRRSMVFIVSLLVVAVFVDGSSKLKHPRSRPTRVDNACGQRL